MARLSRLDVLGGLDCLDARYHQHAFAPHSHDTFVIGVWEAGAATVRCDSRVGTYAADDVLVINPGTVHSAGAAAPEGWRYRAIYPSVALVEAVLADGPGNPALFFEGAQVSDGRLAADIRTLLGRLSHRAEASGLEEALVALIHRLWNRASVSSRQQHGAARSPLVRAREYIDAHATEALSLGRIASEAGMSRYHLVRAFAERFGQTPYAYFMERRVHEARRLLGEGGRPIEVAIRCGFADQSHLTRHFKRIVGVTPGEYRVGA